MKQNKRNKMRITFTSISLHDMLFYLFCFVRITKSTSTFEMLNYK